VQRFSVEQQPVEIEQAGGGSDHGSILNQRRILWQLLQAWCPGGQAGCVLA
jgi:hypothetical protein